MENISLARLKKTLGIAGRPRLNYLKKLRNISQLMPKIRMVGSTGALYPRAIGYGTYQLGNLSKEEFPSTVDCIRSARVGVGDEAPKGG